MGDAAIPMMGTPLKIDSPNTLMAQNQALTAGDISNQAGQQKVDEGKIDLENAKRAQQARDHLSTLIKENTKTDDSGKISTNWDSVSNGWKAAGYGPESLKLDADRAKAAEAAVAQHEAEIRMHGQVATQVGSLAGSVGKVNLAETDPTKLQQDKNSWAARATYAINTGSRKGLITPMQAAQWSAQVANGGWSQEMENQFDQIAKASITAEQNAQNHTAELNAQRMLLEGKERMAKMDQDTERVERQNTGQLLGQASSAQDYLNRFDSIKDPNIKRYYDDPRKPGFDFTAASRKALLSGMSEQGIVAMQDRKSRLEETADWHDREAGFRAEQLAIERMRAGRENNTADRAAMNQTRGELFKLQDQERSLYKQRADLEGALASGGKIYITKSGEAVDMNKAALTGESTAAALTAEMARRYQQSTETAVSLAGQKDGLMEGVGVKPTTNAEDVRKGLEKGANSFMDANPAPFVGVRKQQKQGTDNTGKQNTLPGAETHASGGKQQGGPVRLNMPDGTPIRFKSRADADKFMAAHGMKMRE